MEVVEKELGSCTWRELETNGKFSKNDKLSFITDDMLIVGCDIGSETHYIRAIDVRGRELSRGAFEFSNTPEGFENAKAWMLELAAKNDKKQIVLGLEPTGTDGSIGNKDIQVTHSRTLSSDRWEASETGQGSGTETRN